MREELFGQCFDEIIRQVTIAEPERGLLLLRVREEIKMTIQAYQTLYQSAVTFGMRKQIQSEKGKTELEERIKELALRQSKLDKKIAELNQKKDDIEENNKDRREVEEKEREDEIDFLKNQESHLQKYLKQITDKKA